MKKFKISPIIDKNFNINLVIKNIFQLKKLNEIKICFSLIYSIKSLKNAKIVNEILKSIDNKIDFIGFHGQTIFHNSEEKISKQLGDGNLLSQLTRHTVVFDFRQNDLKNGGEGAPLTP